MSCNASSMPADNLAYVPERARFNRRAGSVFANSNQDGLSALTAAIYQQLQQPLDQQTLPIRSSPAAGGN